MGSAVPVGVDVICCDQGCSLARVNLGLQRGLQAQQDDMCSRGFILVRHLPVTDEPSCLQENKALLL
jgi:hypothetical protein